MNPENANQRVAIVSGGSRGLGRTVTERLLTAGWRVGSFGRSANDFVHAATSAFEGRFLWQDLDLSEPRAIRDFVKQATARFGAVDFLLNNAAVLHQGLLLNTPAEQIHSLISVNLSAPILLAQACARVMAARGQGGVIINVSSINSIRGYRGTSVYAATKAGLDGFTRSLARELGPLNIRVNSVLPGFFDTQLTGDVTAVSRERILKRTPMQRLASIEDVANMISFLISPEAAFITGQTLIVDGGITC